ncbi:MAG: cupin domain-containing protein [Anaerolineae bacterium]|jgi:quercetin dioxygenase-like cupin family protein|nr:cupin domain-containing protein [Anaerolineae bacterium]MBT7782346.1 cupin domain-containing protein [Anaerolineae bacterium]
MPFIALSTIEEKEIIKGYHAKLLHAKNMTAAFWRVEAGSELPEHEHKHEQVSIVISGKFEMILDGKKQILDKGMVALIPSNVKHGGKAITDCEIRDVFYPVREDYR